LTVAEEGETDSEKLPADSTETGTLTTTGLAPLPYVRLIDVVPVARGETRPVGLTLATPVFKELYARLEDSVTSVIVPSGKVAMIFRGKICPAASRKSCGICAAILRGMPDRSTSIEINLETTVWPCPSIAHALNPYFRGFISGGRTTEK